MTSLIQLQDRQQIINNQFVIQKQIAEGSFGTVFLATDLKTNLEVAVKVENQNDEVCSFEREIKILNLLNGVNGIPKMLWNGFEMNNNFIVVELLGKDLENQTKSLETMSMKSLVQMAVQIIRILERIHKLKVVHRDLKPDNILLGLRENKSKFYLIDFGISKIYKNGYNQDGVNSKIKSFIGTSRYASVAAHKGYRIGRKDDIESLMYVLVYFYKGILPWQNMSIESQEERTYKVGQMKEFINLNDLCQQMPSEFKQIFMFFMIIQIISAEPDYSYILNQFFMIAMNQKFILDDEYDWSQKYSLISDNFQQQIGELIPPRQQNFNSLDIFQNQQAINRTQSPNIVMYKKDFQIIFDEKIQFPQPSNI